jgi:hypothetical protein
MYHATDKEILPLMLLTRLYVNPNAIPSFAMVCLSTVDMDLSFLHPRLMILLLLEGKLSRAVVSSIAAATAAVVVDDDGLEDSDVDTDGSDDSIRRSVSITRVSLAEMSSSSLWKLLVRKTL